MPERITWSAVLVLESSELIRSQCTYTQGRSSMWGWFTKICSGTAPVKARIGRHVIQRPLPLPLLSSDATWHLKQNQTSKLSKDRTVRIFRVVRYPRSIRSHTPSPRRKRRIRSSIISSGFAAGSPLLLIPHCPHPPHPSDKPPIRRRGHLFQSQRRRPQNSHAEDPPRARRKGRGHAENLRYSTRLASPIPFPHSMRKFY